LRCTNIRAMISNGAAAPLTEPDATGIISVLKIDGERGTPLGF